MRKSSIAAVAVLLFGLFMLGMRLSKTVPQKLPAPTPAAVRAANAVTTVNVVPSPDAIPKPSSETKPAHTNLPKDKNKDKVSTAIKPAPTNAPKAPAVPPAMLDIEMEHNFTSAELSVWVDDHPAYSRKLEGTDKRRMVVFHSVQGHESHAIQLAPGQRSVRVQIASGVNSSEQSGTVTGEFVSGQEKMLRIHFNKRGEMTLSLQ
jgi:hypothetical protein